MSSDGAADEDGSDAAPTVTVTTGEPPTDAAADEGDAEGLGRAGWVLVAAVVVAVLVVPGLIYLWPAGGAALGATYRSAMLVLPMIPAVILGLIAVWSMRDWR